MVIRVMNCATPERRGFILPETLVLAGLVITYASCAPAVSLRYVRGFLSMDEPPSGVLQLVCHMRHEAFYTRHETRYMRHCSVSTSHIGSTLTSVQCVLMVVVWVRY